MGPDIEMDQLSLQLNGVTILPPITARLKAGQLHVITGPNGAGKSSLMKALLGLLPHSGDIRRHWPGKPGKVAYVPQQTAFEPSLPVTVQEFLLSSLNRRAFFGRRRKQDLQRVAELLQQVGMEGKEHLRLGQLSGGERQRLLFAQALEQQALFWCLDEPMTGLDQQAQEIITAAIQQLRQQGATLLVIQHDPAWTEQHADCIWKVEDGLRRSA
ncbi:metal ABC transporter ATP-binding protein [Marinospirillum alkaliphilum]|uniref:Zinc transport system ATP-binding protein n=1 Tax=Marinospirillum alkaliphilum DSM 21637 TaxID=1122209 RepID=A0A1K1UWS8_9GAMM|nr:metal ABC transporter ATP-binding protein [Marinospirillum alkaliphilum]SFX17294.1 zinc transport system ATP-binding protein [Marinospirillum alkaliphilum DSM 21637]